MFLLIIIIKKFNNILVSPNGIIFSSIKYKNVVYLLHFQFNPIKMKFKFGTFK